MKYLENILFIVPMLTGIIYLIAGWFLQSRPPKKINNMYGYRTKASFQSQKHWDFAQEYSGNLLIKCGIFSILFSLLAFVLPEGYVLGLVLVLLLSFGICWLVYRNTENALKRIE